MMKTLNHAVTAALLAGGSLLGLSAPAFAQQAAEAEEKDPAFGEIIVTAQKREQNLQDIPISISAISGEQAELQGLTEVKDIAAIAPNVSVLGGTTNAAAAVVTIRGIPTPADETQGFDSPIGLYLDGVYLARSSTASFEVADIERIEVLRGPQGTLFGRNTTGGAVNFITREPSEETSLKLRGGVGNYSQQLFRASLDTGRIVGDTMKMTFTGLYKRRDGVVDNLLQPKDRLDPGGAKTTGFRWGWVFEPSESVKITNILDYTKTTGVPHAQQLAALGNGVPNTTVFVPGFNNVTPAPVQQYLAQSTILQPGCGKDVSLTRLDKLCLDGAGTSTDKIWGDMFRLDVDMGGVTLRSTTAYRQWRNNIRGSDLDGLGSLRGALFNIGSPTAPLATFTGFPTSVLTNIGIPLPNAQFLTAGTVPQITQSLFQAKNIRRQNQFSQEIELLSDSDGPFNWVLGAFFFKENGYEKNDPSFGFVLDTNQAVYNSNTFFNPATGGGILPSFNFPAGVAAALAPGVAAAFQAANPARYRVVPQASTLGYRARGRSTAVYGQAEFRPGGKDGAFGVTLGLRYTWDKKEMERFQNGAAAYTNPVEIALNDKQAKFSDWTGNLTVDYRANDDVNLYARIARGYRSGGFNARQPTNVAGNVGLLPFDNEVIWSYEAGVKAKFGGFARINASVFYNDYSDLQLAVPIPITGGGSFGTAVDNAGKVVYTGFEIEAQIKPTDNIWFDGNIGYTHKKFKEYNTLNAANQPADISAVVEPAYAPDWTGAIAANARFPIGGDANVTARVGYTYISDYFMFGNPITAPFKNQTIGDSRGLIDAQLRIDGISLGNAAKNIGITFWGKNLNNKSYLSRAVDFGQLGLAGAIYGDPRTFGVTLDLEF
jgi:iron complex outermembrane recepter protein